MNTIKDFLSDNAKVVKGPVNTYSLTEEFNEYVDTKNSYTILFTKNKGCIVETKRIGESEYSFLYKIVSIIYPDTYPDKLKMDLSVNDIFSERKFYFNLITLEEMKKEYDKFYQLNNEYKFYPLSDLQMANEWFKKLNKEEKKYVKLLNKTI